MESVQSDSVLQRVTRIKKNVIPKSIRHFTLSYEEWQTFYQRKTGKVERNWADKINKSLFRAGVACVANFQKHYVRAKGSRKKNCNIFSCQGYCGRQSCPVKLSVLAHDGPRKQGDPVIFTVVIYNEMNHTGTAQRPLQGERRAAMGMFDNMIQHWSMRSFQQNKSVRWEHWLFTKKTCAKPTKNF